MSDILDMAHDMANDLHAAGAMDAIMMRMMDQLCLPKKRAFTSAEIRRIRQRARMSQSSFAVMMGVGASTVAQWEQGNKKPSGASARLLDIIDRKGIEAIA
jgi:putative transcriptional regulator